MNYVIIGTGAAGIMAAKEIRKLKKMHRLSMISADEQVHSRCMLSQISFPRKDGGRVVRLWKKTFLRKSDRGSIRTY